MRCSYTCGSPEHGVSRRGFLAGLAGGALGAAGFGALVHPAAARELEKKQRRALVIWLHGGVSQLETWDPKPGTDTGGPFQAIPTSVPGVQICELLPQTARQMHRMALVRGVNTHENDHAKGQYLGAAPLQPVATATSVRVRDGKRLVMDGPFAETHEQLGGFFLIEAKDLDEAIGIAARVPGARKGTVEVRPVLDLAGLPDV